MSLEKIVKKLENMDSPCNVARYNKLKVMPRHMLIEKLEKLNRSKYNEEKKLVGSTIRGDVLIAEIQGMAELNNITPHEIDVIADMTYVDSCEIYMIINIEKSNEDIAKEITVEEMSYRNKIIMMQETLKETSDDTDFI
jgi:hypothetical protein